MKRSRGSPNSVGTPCHFRAFTLRARLCVTSLLVLTSISQSVEGQSQAVPGGGTVLISRSQTGDQYGYSGSIPYYGATGFEGAPVTMSRDGGLTVYVSIGTYTVPQVHNFAHGVFGFDRNLGYSRELSIAPSMTYHGVIEESECSWVQVSGDGGTIALHTRRPDISTASSPFGNGWLLDVSTGAWTLIGPSLLGSPIEGGAFPRAISHDGRFCAFTAVREFVSGGPSPSPGQLFRFDRTNSSIVECSVSTQGVPANATSGEGSCGANYSFGTFASYYSGFSNAVDMSADGRYVTFVSRASNLVAGSNFGYPQVYLRDFDMGTTICVSQDSQGTKGNSGSLCLSMSSDSRYIAFVSNASNLVTLPVGLSSSLFLWVFNYLCG